MINNKLAKVAATLLASALAAAACVPASALANPTIDLVIAGEAMDATSVHAGDYAVDITSNNRMFKPTEGLLHVGKGSARVSFNHTTYTFVWLGTVEEYKAAAKAGDVTADARYIEGEATTSLNSSGQLKAANRFTLPVTRLNEAISICVYSPSKNELLERQICVNCADASALKAAANVEVSVSTAGKLASDDNASLSPMAARQVVASDTNGDGKVSCAEALEAAGSKYMRDGKALAKHSVFKNGKLVAKAGKEQVADGDALTAFTYAKKGKDSYAAFSKSTAKVKAGGSLKLTLKSIEAKKATAKAKLAVVKGAKKISVTCSQRFGIDGAAAAQVASAKLSKKGTVSLKFKDAGTYVVTASGKTAKGSTIVAPVCLVTVSA